MNVITWKRLHNWIGMASAAFLAVLLATGILLNHPGWMHKKTVRAIALDPRAPQTIYQGEKDGLYRSTDGGATWDEVPMLYPPQDVSDIEIAADGRIYALEKWGKIFASRDGGRVWRAIELPFDAQTEGIELRQIAAGSEGRLAVLTSHGRLTSSDDGGSWDESALSRESMPVHRLIVTLHNGYFFGPKFVWVYDAAALALLFLIISGVILWNSDRTKRV